MITLDDEARILSERSVLKGLSGQTLRQLAFSSDRVVFSKGDLLVEQGQDGDVGYLILSGTVTVTLTGVDGTKTLATVGEGFLAGDGTLIAGGTYSVTVKAASPVEALRIRRENLLRVIDGDKTAMTEIMRILLDRKASAEERFSVTFD